MGIIRAIGSRHAWTGYQKWVMAIANLKDDAKEWHESEGIRQSSWNEWCARLIAAFGKICPDEALTSESNQPTTDGGTQERCYIVASHSPTLVTLFDYDCLKSCPVGVCLCMCGQKTTLRKWAQEYDGARVWAARTFSFRFRFQCLQPKWLPLFTMANNKILGPATGAYQVFVTSLI
ncbi:hypothetical protein HPB50_008540 [Hyalomma asiaticum]|uniref:Uncharacterized protein n=1 Tax=Hyalomma asiaticum TaxID=266040 RepID=A0ACB7SF42_HYAAI|nr:hypothetical protein HPB50_008540 [Hyalomma asiaticum]